MQKNQFKQEVALVSYGFDIVDIRFGNPASVEFDFETIWGYIKTQDNFIKEDLHFFHSHPPGFDFCSETDRLCLKGLNMAFGYPINFWILSPDLSLSRYTCVDDKINRNEIISVKYFSCFTVAGLSASLINTILSKLSCSVMP